MSTTLITTAEAAGRLGLTVRAVQKMIEGGRLEAQKLGRDYFIDPTALENIPKQIQGRPPKAKSETAPATNGMTTRATKKRAAQKLRRKE